MIVKSKLKKPVPYLNLEQKILVNVSPKQLNFQNTGCYNIKKVFHKYLEDEN